MWKLLCSCTLAAAVTSNGKPQKPPLPVWKPTLTKPAAMSADLHPKASPSQMDPFICRDSHCDGCSIPIEIQGSRMFRWKSCFCYVIESSILNCRHVTMHLVCIFLVLFVVHIFSFLLQMKCSIVLCCNFYITMPIFSLLQVVFTIYIKL